MASCCARFGAIGSDRAQPWRARSAASKRFPRKACRSKRPPASFDSASATSRTGPPPMRVRKASRACSASSRWPTSSNSGASIPRIRTVTSPDRVAMVNVSPSITDASRPGAPSRSTSTAGFGDCVGLGDRVGVGSGVTATDTGGLRTAGSGVGIAEGSGRDARGAPVIIGGGLLATVAARAVRRRTTVSSYAPLQADNTAVATAPARRPRATSASFRVPHQVVPVDHKYCTAKFQVHRLVASRFAVTDRIV